MEAAAVHGACRSGPIFVVADGELDDGVLAMPPRAC